MPSIRDTWFWTLERIFKRQIYPYHIKVGNDLLIILPRDIIRVEADGSYSILITTSESYYLSRNIMFLQKELGGWGFVRISRSHILNVSHVRQILKGKISNVLMSDGSKIRIPFRKKNKMTRKIERMSLRSIHQFI